MGEGEEEEERNEKRREGHMKLSYRTNLDRTYFSHSTVSAGQQRTVQNCWPLPTPYLLHALFSLGKCANGRLSRDVR